MKDSNIIKEKSFNFSIRIVNLYKYLTIQKKEFVLSNQVLRSGTSIGANICESTQSVSTADFLSKLSISLKEACETEYWIKLLYRTEYIDKSQHDSVIFDCQELIKMLTSIIKKTKENLINNNSDNF
ncbi:MAG: four helix bundle protein [Bacteroidales bacterium]|nr:four helix bundle protein [Bacteroidales bacterium]